jgi:hypothetical protein
MLSLADGATPKAVVISPGTVSSLSRGFKPLKSIGGRKAHDVFEPMGHDLAATSHSIVD